MVKTAGHGLFSKIDKLHIPSKLQSHVYFQFCISYKSGKLASFYSIAIGLLPIYFTPCFVNLDWLDIFLKISLPIVDTA